MTLPEIGLQSEKDAVMAVQKTVPCTGGIQFNEIIILIAKDSELTLKF